VVVHNKVRKREKERKKGCQNTARERKVKVTTFYGLYFFKEIKSAFSFSVN